MTLWVKGAFSKKNLQRRSIRWVFGDETFQWPAGNMAEAEARTTSFGWLGKCVFFSQGSEWEDDTHKKFLSTDQREWCFKCPHCGEFAPYKWENVEWDADAKNEETGEWDYERVNTSAALKCPHCGQYLEDTDRMRLILNRDGKFVAQNSRASKEKVGFHWNSLASMSWGVLAEMYLRAKKATENGDITELKNFYQKRLGIFWQEFTEDYKIEVEASGYKLGENWDDESAIGVNGGIISPPFDIDENGRQKVLCKLRIITVDVQMTCLYCVVRAWNTDGSSRLIWRDKVVSWNDIDALAERFKINPSFVFIDAGYDQTEVCKQCAARGWIALKGDQRASYRHKLENGSWVWRFYSPTGLVNVGAGKYAKFYHWSNLNCKDTLNRLRRNQNPVRGATWELPSDIDDEYLKMMDSERRVKKGNTFVWEQVGHRPNHYWDCEAMQIAVGYMLKILGNGNPDKGDKTDESASV